MIIRMIHKKVFVSGTCLRQWDVIVFVYSHCDTNNSHME